jgi:hypothetical protein
MDAGALLATVPVAFFDPRSGLSALALQHVRADGRTVLVYHDAPSVAAARPLLSACPGFRQLPLGERAGRFLAVA